MVGSGRITVRADPCSDRTLHSRRHGPNGEGACTAIVNHDNPGTWHGTSVLAPVTTVPCTNDTEVLDGVLGALDAHQFVFARLVGSGCPGVCVFPLNLHYN
jgi:hypothetical protein